jgi:hypothetical protein
MQNKNIPARNSATLLLAIALTAFFWRLAWSKDIAASQYAFFPLWFGYILTIDRLSEYRYGTSLLKRLGRDFPILFVVSAPFWWFFEFLNKYVVNWHYVYDRPISDIQYVIEATMDFTVVLPAVMSTIFLFSRIFEAHEINFGGRPLQFRKMVAYFLAIAGLISVALIVLYPTIAFPLVWIAPIFLLESLARALNYPSLFQKLESGNYTLALLISAATVFNGIVWEFWNYYSSPKWLYTIPHVGFLKIFEMPVFGYLGYPFFGMIVYNFALLLFAFIRGVDRVEEVVD